MKSISFSKGIEKDIHININMNYYEEFLSKYLSRYGSLLIMDSGLKNILITMAITLFLLKEVPKLNILTNTLSYVN